MPLFQLTISQKNTGTQQKYRTISRKITVPYHASGYSAQQVTYVSDGYYVHSQEEFTVTVTFEKPISGLLLLQMHVNNRLGDGSTTGDVAITVNGIRNKLTDPDWKYQNLNNAFRYTLSSNEPIRELKVTFSSGDYIISDVALYTISYQALEDAGDQITPFQVKHADIGDDTISGSIDVTQDSWFVLSVPYDEGFSCFVDGKEVPIVKNRYGFYRISNLCRFSSDRNHLSCARFLRWH